MYDIVGKGEDTHVVTWKHLAASRLRKTEHCKGFKNSGENTGLNTVLPGLGRDILESGEGPGTPLKYDGHVC